VSPEVLLINLGGLIDWEIHRGEYERLLYQVVCAYVDNSSIRS